MVDSLFSLLWQLPAGLLLAALLLEVFILQNSRRELEPAVLWLLCCAAIGGAVAAVAHYLTQGATMSFASLAALAALLTSLGFWFKRQARNKGVLKLTDRFYRGDSYVPVKVPNQAFYIYGFRMMTTGALAAAVAAFVASATGKPKAKQGTLVQNTPVTATEAAQAQANANAVAPATTNTPAAPATTPTPDATPATVPTVAATPPPAPATPTTEPAPTTPPATPEAGMVANTTAAPAPASATAPAAPTTAPAPAAAPAAAAPVKPAAVVMADARPVSKNSIFASKIRPIIQRYCVTCHGPEKVKGDVRLDSPDHIRAGAAGKPVLLAGKPLQSTFYTLLAKPIGDEDRMPPKGDGVSKADAELIRKWIEAGADMGDGVSTASSGGVEFKADKISGALVVPPAELIEELKKKEVNLRYESKDGKLLNLVFSYSTYTQAELQAVLPKLGSIAQNIYSLDLSRTDVTDADLVNVGTMANLHSLNLGRTSIGDAGMAHLAQLAQLETLNIYQSKVSDAGVQQLKGLKNLKNLYVFQTMVTEAGAKDLQAAVSGVKIDLGK